MCLLYNFFGGGACCSVCRGLSGGSSILPTTPKGTQQSMPFPCCGSDPPPLILLISPHLLQLMFLPSFSSSFVFISEALLLTLIHAIVPGMLWKTDETRLARSAGNIPDNLVRLARNVLTAPCVERSPPADEASLFWKKLELVLKTLNKGFLHYGADMSCVPQL